MQYSDERPAADITLYVYAGSNGEFQLYEDEGTNYNYEKGQYATIPISYDDATHTLTIGKREGKFPGMLLKRRFNVVFVTPDQPRQLDLDAPEGRMVEYAGKPVIVRL
jgi:alpha-D-xyloside xylohydrolase